MRKHWHAASDELIEYATRADSAMEAGRLLRRFCLLSFVPLFLYQDLRITWWCPYSSDTQKNKDEALKMGKKKKLIICFVSSQRSDHKIPLATKTFFPPPPPLARACIMQQLCSIQSVHTRSAASACCAVEYIQNKSHAETLSKSCLVWQFKQSRLSCCWHSLLGLLVCFIIHSFHTVSSLLLQQSSMDFHHHNAAVRPFSIVVVAYIYSLQFVFSIIILSSSKRWMNEEYNTRRGHKRIHGAI